MQKSSIEPEIFGFFQHKVEQTPHFAHVSEVRHIFVITVKGLELATQLPLV